jgi:hypothetical protein
VAVEEAEEAGGGKRDCGPVIDLSGSPEARDENQHSNSQESRDSSSRGSNSEADMDDECTVSFDSVVELGNDYYYDDDDDGEVDAHGGRGTVIDLAGSPEARVEALGGIAAAAAAVAPLLNASSERARHSETRDELELASKRADRMDRKACVQESKSDDVTKHDATVKKLEGKIADLERIVKDFTDQKEAATVSAAEATLDCSKLNHKVQELSLELKAAEKKLKSAKILGAKVAPTAELASTKFELTTAQTWITVYKEMAVNELTATIDSLTSQLSGSREDAFKAIARLESLTSEARRYQLDAKNSNANYERDLALHTEAHAALRDARSGMESEQRLHDTIESQRTSIETEKVAWETSKKKLEESLLEAKSKLDDLSTI